MNQKLVITALGKDRPGIVNELSNTLLTHELNIEDSRMSVLGGEFAILLLVTGSKQAISHFIDKKQTAESALSMTLTVKTTETSAPAKNLIPYDVEVIAIDHPGIVHKLTSFFSGKQINIVDLETDRYAAPHTGTPMFALNMTIGIPAETSIASLRDDFLNMCDDLNLDAKISATG
ncbi:MAG: glycine cleavage system protein R [Gammaproteobacteria bacterium]|nr:glycine cleavage system protein R [Gammaproteobacteria bacterium]MCW8923200.1 glycine cleavage system protein R [Gammaproteobacteria bacterium]